MIIDFHIHGFTDTLAGKAVGQLSKTAGIPAYSDGTVADTEQKLASWNVDYGVMLNIATKPTQQTVINDWAAAQNNHHRILSFGSVHPDAPDAVEELHRIKKLGLYGVKLHPDYQRFFIQDEKAFPIYDTCAKLNLPVVFHAGYDPVSPDAVHATPEHAAHVAKQFPKMTMILAHLGGINHWEDVLKYVVGVENILLDTAFCSGNIEDDLALRIIQAHGTDKILFGSDLPWHPSDAALDFLHRLPLSDSDRCLILSENARKILSM